MLENNEGSPRVEAKRVGFCGSGHADVKFVENVRGGGCSIRHGGNSSITSTCAVSRVIGFETVTDSF